MTFENIVRMPGMVALAISALTLFGACIGAAIGFFASRKTESKIKEAQDRLTDTLDKTVERVTGEREEYRTTLSEERKAHQACELRAKELESKPDLSSLVTLLNGQESWMKALGETLRQHSESDARIFGKLEESVSRLPRELEKMSQAFDERQQLALSEIRRGNGH